MAGAREIEIYQKGVFAKAKAFSKAGIWQMWVFERFEESRCLGGKCEAKSIPVTGLHLLTAFTGFTGGLPIEAYYQYTVGGLDPDVCTAGTRRSRCTRCTRRNENPKAGG